MRERLMRIVCDRCGRTVAWAIPGASAWCRSCGRWTKPAREPERPREKRILYTGVQDVQNDKGE